MPPCELPRRVIPLGYHPFGLPMLPLLEAEVGVTASLLPMPSLFRPLEPRPASLLLPRLATLSMPMAHLLAAPPPAPSLQLVPFPLYYFFQEYCSKPPHLPM